MLSYIPRTVHYLHHFFSPLPVFFLLFSPLPVFFLLVFPASHSNKAAVCLSAPLPSPPIYQALPSSSPFPAAGFSAFSSSFTCLFAAFLPFPLSRPLLPHNIIGQGEVAVGGPSLPQAAQRRTQLSPCQTPQSVFTSIRIMKGRGRPFRLSRALRFHAKIKETEGKELPACRCS